MRFTAKTIEALELPPGKTEATVWDDTMPGFGVRMRGNAKRWRIQYRIHNQQRSESLGDVRKVDLEAARKIARQRFAKVELGIDPGAERDAKRQAVTAARNTLGHAVERYLEARKDELRPKTVKSAVRYLRDYWSPLHGSPLDEIKRVQVASLLHDLTRKHGRVTARECRKNLSALFSWAMREGMCDVNPVIGSNNPGSGIKPRDRILDDAELRSIWQACVVSNDDYARVVQLLLYSLCRRDEIGSLCWDELDLRTGRMVLPAARTKTHRTHELILPEPAVKILRAQARLTNRPWVFGQAGRGLTGWSWHKNRFDRLVTEAAGRVLPQWQVHDLRRTGATRIAEFAPPHIVEALLIHAKPTLVATYNLATYRAEKAQALATWAEKLTAIVEGRAAKIVHLSQHQHKV